jgi:hypothetical protein
VDAAAAALPFRKDRRLRNRNQFKPAYTDRSPMVCAPFPRPLADSLGTAGCGGQVNLIPALPCDVDRESPSEIERNVGFGGARRTAGCSHKWLHLVRVRLSGRVQFFKTIAGLGTIAASRNYPLRTTQMNVP